MVDITLEYSRPFRALKLWLAFRAHGAAAFRAAMERNFAQARLLYDGSRATTSSSALRRRRRSRSCRSVTSARRRQTSTSTTRGWSGRSRTTAASGSRLRRSTARVCLRPCIVNFRTTDDDVRALVELTRELGGGAGVELYRHQARGVSRKAEQVVQVGLLRDVIELEELAHLGQPALLDEADVVRVLVVAGVGGAVGELHRDPEPVAVLRAYL